MRYISLLVVLVLFAVPAVRAATIDVGTNARSIVYFDDMRMGRGPMLLQGVPNGDHTLLVRDPRSGASKRFDLKVEGLRDDKRIDVGFNTVSEMTLSDEGSFTEHRTVVDVATGGHVEESRGKVRTRNTALGAAGVGAAAGMAAIPIIGLGAAVINEVANK